MKWNLTYLISFVFGVVISFIAKSQDDFTQGIEAYNQKDYALAVNKFEKVLATTPNNTSAWYNLGLSNIGLKSYGKAIWSFEKVLKYKPNDSQAEEKIEYCYNQLYPEQEWQPRLNSFESSLYSISPNKWSIISIILSVICAFFIFLYFTLKQSSLRNAILTVNIFFVCGFIFSIVTASLCSKYYSNSNFAIVTKKSIPTFIGDAASSKTKISEGNRVEIIEEVKDTFVKVKTSTDELHVVSINGLSFI